MSWLGGYRSLWVALGIVGAKAQHTKGEADALRRWASGRSAIVEIGVAEGASAAVLLSSMSSGGNLWLVDPFHLSRNPLFNTGQWAARRTVAGESGSTDTKIHFVQMHSEKAVRGWSHPLDLLFIDGDHSYDSVLADWNAWSPFLVSDGLVAFHDAVRVLGHPDGPARVVDDLFRGRPLPGWTIVEEIDSLVVVCRSD